MEIEIFIIFIVLTLLYFIIESFFNEYREIKILFLGAIISVFIFILSRNVQDKFTSSVFNILSAVTMIITIFLVIYSYIQKLGTNNES